jgi:polyphosphate kinase
MSENIRVVSIIGRFLEHSRIFYFGNLDQPEVYIGSADLMRRNLDRRIEVLCPVEQPDLIAHLRDHILANCLKDNSKAWYMDSTGTYLKPKRKSGAKAFCSQNFFMSEPSTKILRG